MNLIMDNIFGDNLQTLRKKKKLTIAALARDLEINSTSLRFYELGKSQPTLANIVAIIKYFGVTANFMLFGEADKPTEQKVKTEDKADPYIKLSLEDKIKYLRIGLSLQAITLEDNDLRKVIVTYEKVMKKGGAFSIHDALSIEQGVKGDDMSGK